MNSSIRRTDDAEEVERKAQIPPLRCSIDRDFPEVANPLWFVEYAGKKTSKPCTFRAVFYAALERQLAEIDAAKPFLHIR